jgi:hypothetical protein
MPEPYIQLREIDRRVADFDSREAALEQERKALENRLQSIELVKDLNADKVKALQDELAEVNTRIAAVNGLQREVEGHKAELERQLALLSKKIDAAVAREVAKLGDRSQRVKQLMELKFRNEYGVKYAATKTRYLRLITKLEPRANQLGFYARKLKARADAVTKMIQAWNLQQPINQPNDRSALAPVNDPKQVANRLATLRMKQAELSNERSAFNSREGKGGEKAKLRLQGDLLDRMNAVLRTKGFVDPIEVLERTAKSLPDLSGTALTFLMKVARANRASLLQTLDVHDIVRVKAFEGDASPHLSTLVDAFCDQLKLAISTHDAVEDAVQWWKTRPAANTQLAALDAQLSSRLKFRFRRAYSEAVGLWIKQNLD